MIYTWILIIVLTNTDQPVSLHNSEKECLINLKMEKLVYPKKRYKCLPIKQETNETSNLIYL